MLDVDCFKAYNDSYGHPAGDEVLKVLGEILNGSTRSLTDMAARIGGEEFAVILPETSGDGVDEIAERITEGLKRRSISHGSSKVAEFVTVSMGIAFAGKEGVEDFILRADKALYSAKEAGRNRVFKEEIPVVEDERPSRDTVFKEIFGSAEDLSARGDKNIADRD